MQLSSELTVVSNGFSAIQNIIDDRIYNKNIIKADYILSLGSNIFFDIIEKTIKTGMLYIMVEGRRYQINSKTVSYDLSETTNTVNRYVIATINPSNYLLSDIYVTYDLSLVDKKSILLFSFFDRFITNDIYGNNISLIHGLENFVIKINNGYYTRIYNDSQRQDYDLFYSKFNNTLDTLPYGNKIDLNTEYNGDGSVVVRAGGYHFLVYDIREIKGEILVKMVIDAPQLNDIYITLCHYTSNYTEHYQYKTIIDNYKVYTDDETERVETSYILTLTEEDRSDYNFLCVRIDYRSYASEDFYAIVKQCEAKNPVIKSDIEIVEKSDIVYVATTGNDSNDGTIASPFATVDRALEYGASTILIKSGKYNQQINLSKSTRGNIIIKNSTQNENVIFLPPNNKHILSSTETKLDGYERIYFISLADTPSEKWLFQDSIQDEYTLISDLDRMPQQRGQNCRCLDTKILKSTASTLSDALSDIEASSRYKWYYDSSTNLLYFSRPQTITESNPLTTPTSTQLFKNGNRKYSVECYGIESKYMAFNFTDLGFAKAVDCKCGNVINAGSFSYDRCLAAEFIRCEAYNAISGSNGDGFNAHSNSTGEIYSKQTTVSLIECWSHDNNDDGYSDHERSETTIIGGLYENNLKGGITPSYGSHCTCHDVCSRYNYNGFYYVGKTTVAEGGKDGQMICYNCYAKGNNSNSPGCGFGVLNASNSMKLINCITDSNKYSIFVDSGCTAEIINHRSYNDNYPSLIYENGNLIIKNPELLS